MTQTVMKLFPVGTYLSAEKEDTIAEDSKTYAMILEKQANDENAVDENGKLITQDAKCHRAGDGEDTRG